METLDSIMTELKNNVESLTIFFKEIFPKNKEPNSGKMDIIFKFVPAYVFFMKNYYEAKAKYEILKIKKESGESINLSDFKNIFFEINKASELLNEYVKIKKIAIGSSEKTGLAKMAKWNEKTPKSKMLKYLEIWTGEKGEKAVTKSLLKLKNNSNLLFDKIMHTNGVNNFSNKIISSIFSSQIEKLFKYYIHHRDKYTPDAALTEKKKISFGEKVNIKLKDKFVNLDFKIGWCEFESFNKAISELISGIDKVDSEFISKSLDYSLHSSLHSSLPCKEEKEKEKEKEKSKNKIKILSKNKEDLMLRKKLKTDILDISKTISEDLHCEKLNFDVKFEANEIIPLVQSLYEAEKIIVKEMNLIKDNLKMQTANADILQKKIDQLTGPDTRPCLLKFLNSAQGMSLQKAKSYLLI